MLPAPKLPDGIHMDDEGNYRNAINRVVVSALARDASALRAIADHIEHAYGQAEADKDPKVVYPHLYNKPRLTWAR